MNKTLDKGITEALDHLDKFLDPTNTGCAVDPAVREAARLYLDSWVREPLAAAQAYNRGDRDWSLMNYLELIR